MYYYYYFYYTAITTSTVVNANLQPQFQLVKSRTFITLPAYIPQANQGGSKHRKRKQTHKWWKTSLEVKIKTFIYTTD